MEKLIACPVCNNKEFKNFLSIKDFFLTQEDFSVVKCTKCDFHFTNPRPDRKNILNYYNSNNYISHGKSKNIIYEIFYNLIRNYSFKKKHQIIVNHSIKGNILDVGCGTGAFLNYFKKLGWETFGVEPSLEARKMSKTKFNLEIGDENSLNFFKPETFNVITMWHVLEHVWDINERMSKIISILKPDGIMVIALPNINSWDCKYYSSFWAAWDVPRHLSHFSQSTFQKFISFHNLKLIDSIPLKFDSFYISLLSEKYLNKKFKLINSIKKGIYSNFYAKKNNNNYSSLIYILKKGET